MKCSDATGTFWPCWLCINAGVVCWPVYLYLIRMNPKSTHDASTSISLYQTQLGFLPKHECKPEYVEASIDCILLLSAFGQFT